MGICMVEPGSLSGRLLVPPSKSMGHRALFCAGLADGDSTIDNLVLSDDMLATIAALKALGIGISVRRSERFSARMTAHVCGTGRICPTGEVIDCHESGSTARFVLPVSRLSPEPVTFTGRNRLMDRPFGLFRGLFEGKGVAMEDRDGCLPVTLTGELQSGTFRLPGNVSSQFITGLLFVLPLLSGDSEIQIEGPLESAPYVEMTIDMLAQFGVTAELTLLSGAASAEGEPAVDGTMDGSQKTGVSLTPALGASLHVPGRQAYRAAAVEIEGDWSQAAFWAVAGALGHALTLEGLSETSRQGDREVVGILRRMGADVHQASDGLHISAPRDGLVAVDMDVAQCPDLVPALAIAAAHATGTSRILNAARLRIKESDRLAAMRTQLERLGSGVIERPDGLDVPGTPQGLTGGTVDGCGDHRIVMAMAIAATRASGPVSIEGMEAVRKSYPDFWDDFRQVGGFAHEQHVG